MWASQALCGGSCQGAREEDGENEPRLFLWLTCLEGLPHTKDGVGTHHTAVLFYSHHLSRCSCECSSFQRRSLRFREGP